MQLPHNQDRWQLLLQPLTQFLSGENSSLPFPMADNAAGNNGIPDNANGRLPPVALI